MKPSVNRIVARRRERHRTDRAAEPPGLVCIVRLPGSTNEARVAKPSFKKMRGFFPKNVVQREWLQPAGLTGWLAGSLQESPLVTVLRNGHVGAHQARPAAPKPHLARITCDRQSGWEGSLTGDPSHWRIPGRLLANVKHRAAKERAGPVYETLRKVSAAAAMGAESS